MSVPQWTIINGAWFSVDEGGIVLSGPGTVVRKIITTETEYKLLDTGHWIPIENNSSIRYVYEGLPGEKQITIED
jgi:hypothetical protein